MTHALSHAAQTPLYACMLLTALYAIKFGGWRMPPLPGLEDYGWLVLFELALVGALAGGAAKATLLTLAALGFFALWLDVVLFRVFTIELGPSGIGTAVTTTLYRELVGMRSARRFFRQHLSFALLPVAALAAHLQPSLNPAAGWIVTALLAGYGLALLVAVPGVRATILVLWVAWAAAAIDGGLSTWAVAGAVLWIGWFSGRASASRLIRPFFWRNRPKAARKFPVRSQDALLVELEPRPPQKSDLHGLLAGENVVIWTVESMARDYLASFSPGFAQTPFIDRLIATGVSCSEHFALCPLTNNAHVLLYASAYSEQRGFGPMEALHRVGYRTIYLTSCNTKAYGLRKVLQRAGFEHVLDAPVLRSDPRAPLTDADIVNSACEKLAALTADGRPWFLHVHTANTHVPYRLSDPARFCRFDSHSDFCRFLNGLEEADFHLAQFTSRLSDLYPRSTPLLVVSADHGQSFGQFGYHSHGSAVVKEQVMVPCVFSHPKLERQRIPYSSHLDVMPTILDLLGVAMGKSFGTSVLGPRSAPAWLLWAGHPSRTRTSHFGLVKDQRKYMFDWTVHRGYELQWNDQSARELFGEERSYYGSLISQVAARVGVE